MSAADFAQSLVDEMNELVTAASLQLSPTPDRILNPAPGEAVAWDDSCDGQLWIRLANVGPPENVALGAQNPLDVCRSPYLLLTLELGIIRCAATMEEDMSAPPAAEISADGVQSISDMAVLLQVLRCWPGLRSIITWTPQGPEGGYHGGY